MRKRRTIVMLLCAVAALSLRAQQFVEDSLKVDGRMRHFEVFLPEGIAADAPLVFVLHGYGGGISRTNPMVETATREGFALCIPQGLKDLRGKPSWNVGYPFQEGWKVDDVKALCRMAVYVQRRYRLSRTNTFLTGMSNGGEMCYLMAYSRQKTFKAVAPIAGLTMVWMYRELEAPKPIPLLEIHGTEDRTSEWTGDLTDEGGWGAYMPVPLAVGYWVARNRCTREETERVESLDSESGHYVIKHRFTDSPSGCDVWLYEVVGGGHTWHTGDLRTGDEIWRFFRQYVN
ncbi:MAG: prolyl oligopeptidase family serine peptidase [Bacteroidaceae bacterium]|nr:prolyl oligopeptidase family serine peptidase [Bacteroidaceae bacterium]